MTLTVLTFSLCPIFAQHTAKDNYTIFLIGDTGKNFQPEVNPLFKPLKDQLGTVDENSTIIFLGDNIYSQGMPNQKDLRRREAEQIIDSQIQLVKGFKGNYYFIPGNHDWKKGKKDGWRYIQNQEKYVEDHLDSLNVFIPDGGCPGPVEIHLNEELMLVILDTQWILHPWEKPMDENDCGIASYEEILVKIEDILLRNRHKKIIFSGHHPLFSYGIHGGVTSLKEHIFPLITDNHPHRYIPLPVIGSIYPIYRKWIGNIQDIQHPKYKAFRNVLEALFVQHPNLIYASGHEHSMQYILKDSIHYVVSGAGSKSTYVKQRGYAKYANNQLGFAKLLFNSNGEVNLEIWQLEENNILKNTYTATLFQQDFAGNPSQAELQNIDFSDSMVYVNASDRYKTKSPGIYGENYRKVWRQKINVPVFDISTEKGGLKIIQRGGGQQTRSLRLEAKDGKQYVLRSIEKYAEKAVPEALRGTIAADIVQDQISASHPYGAFVVPKMAEAVGIYHTNPKVVYIADDPRFGVYQNVFADGLFLFEERPDDDLSDYANFGRTENAISTSKMLEKLYKDNDNHVDQLFTLKSRLFDMVIGDWDRHDDQWRWASFEEKKGDLYRPIPRDRDQTFFINQGFLMSIAKKKWALPKIQGFDYEYNYVPGFNYNARYFDRDFLNEPSREDWLNMADTIRHRLTDEVIDQALHDWPQPIYELTGKEIGEKLKSIRDDLDEYALAQYLFLSKSVTVRGSNKHEFFRVERINDEETRVRMYKKTKEDDKDKKLYDRTFKTSETNEIRLFGLGGEDIVTIDGNVNKGTLIRVIGGEEEDEIIDHSSVKGSKKMTRIYDDASGNKIDFGTEAKDLTSNHPDVNLYDRKEFKYDKLLPLVIAKINRDDGLFLGGGFLATKYGFRKDPYKSNHFLLANYAINTGSFNFNYHGTFTEVAGSWDVKLNFDIFFPNYATNFFGYGNETLFNQDADEEYNVDRSIDFYRIRYNHLNNELLLSKRIGENITLDIGNHFQLFKVESDYPGEDRIFLEPPVLDNEENFFDWKIYEGGIFQLNVDTRDNKFLPTRGITFNTDIRGYAGLNEESHGYASFAADYALFFGFRLPAQIILGTRFGAGHTTGDYEFYQAQSIGGLSNVRGFRKTRFYGDTKVYNNIELRLKIATIRNPVAPFSLGITAFNDIGRVWWENENSSTWHHGYGGGIWIAPLNAAVIAIDIAQSKEETGFYARFGFLF